MAENNDGLITLIDNVHLNGVINEIVMSVEDGVAKVMASDMTQSLFVQSEAATTMEDCKIGMQDISLFAKYLKANKGKEIAITKKDNTLSIKPAGGSLVTYLLSEVELVPTYNSEWDGIPDRVGTLPIEGNLVVTVDKVSEFLTMMGLFKPNSVELQVNKNGKTTLHGGNSTTHQFDTTIGVCKEFQQVKMAFFGPQISAIFSAFDFTHTVSIGLVPDDNLMVIKNGHTSWVLSTIQ